MNRFLVEERTTHISWGMIEAGSADEARELFESVPFHVREQRDELRFVVSEQPRQTPKVIDEHEATRLSHGG